MSDHSKANRPFELMLGPTFELKYCDQNLITTGEGFWGRIYGADMHRIPLGILDGPNNELHQNQLQPQREKNKSLYKNTFF